MKRLRWGRHYSRLNFAVASSKGHPSVHQAAAPAWAGGCPPLSGKEENSSLLSVASSISPGQGSMKGWGGTALVTYIQLCSTAAADNCSELFVERWIARNRPEL